MSSTLAVVPRADPAGARHVPDVSVTGRRSDPPCRGPLRRDQRVAMRQRLEQLAAYETDRVERVATIGLARVAAHEIGLRDAVRDALTKLAGGTFGDCEACHRPIPVARLAVVPYARRCLSCQRRTEDGWDQVDGMVGHVVRTLAGEPQGRSEMRS